MNFELCGENMKKTNKKWLGLRFDENVENGGSPPPEISTNGSSFVAKKRNFNFHKSLVPKTVADLAVHPKKIGEVETWLQSNVSGSNTGKFLLITGPTGSGKTVTVQVLCQSLSIDISEWVNPIDQDFQVFQGPNQINRFVEFLTEAKWNSLFSCGVKKVILVEEFPNALARNPEEFGDILEHCYYKGNNPIIFICTDSKDSKMNLSEKLFTSDIKEKYKIAEISFNPCAPTLLKNSLKRAHSLVQQNPDLFKTPSQGTVDAILATSMGDIKSVINQYYFASLLGTSDLPIVKEKHQKSGTKRKRNENSSSVKNMCRDESLGLFHGIGRVLNPKRIENGNNWRLNCNIEKLVDEFSTQPSTFTNFLFENYLKYFGDLNDVCRASEMLSLGQTFLETWVDRQEVLGFSLWVSILGLMIFNAHKVSKWNAITGPKKVQKKKIGGTTNRDLSVMDLYYYNIINKTDNSDFSVNVG